MKKPMGGADTSTMNAVWYNLPSFKVFVWKKYLVTQTTRSDNQVQFPRLEKQACLCHSEQPDIPVQNLANFGSMWRNPKIDYQSTSRNSFSFEHNTETREGIHELLLEVHLLIQHKSYYEWAGNGMINSQNKQNKTQANKAFQDGISSKEMFSVMAELVEKHFKEKLTNHWQELHLPELGWNLSQYLKHATWTKVKPGEYSVKSVVYLKIS